MKYVKTVNEDSSVLRGAVGWALFGPLGGLLGAVSASDGVKIYKCPNCKNVETR